MDSTQTSEEQIVTNIRSKLGSRLTAVYRHGSDFARGRRASRIRLLVLVDKIDREVLDKVVAVGGRGDAQIRVDTVEDVLRSADAFPVFALELLNTRSLLEGNDVLEKLAVEPSDLRLRIEQTFRAIRRDLIQVYLEGGPNPSNVAVSLRGAARKLVYLFEGMLISAGASLPEPRSPEAIIGAVQSLLPEQDVVIWRKLMDFAGFEMTLEPQDLLGLSTDVLNALHNVIGVVDQMDSPS